MTEENRFLRQRLLDVEAAVTNALHSQPSEDGPCRSHLLAALEKIHSMTKPEVRN